MMSKTTTSSSSTFTTILLLIATLGISYLVYKDVFVTSNLESQIETLVQAEYNRVGGKENYEKYTKLVNSKVYKEQQSVQLDNTLKQIQLLEKKNGIEPETSGKKKVNSPIDISKIQYITGTLTDKQLWNDGFLQTKTFDQDVNNSDYLALEYSDLECPYCKAFHKEGAVALLSNEHKDKFATAFVNFPLPMHDNAMAAAEDVLCAQKESFEKGSKVIDEFFSVEKREIASLAKKKTCKTDSKALQSEIRKGMEEGQKLFKVSGTPTLVLVNLKTKKFVSFQSKYDFETINAVFNAEIKNK